MSSVCRVCLAGNKRLNSLDNSLLINVYEKLSNTKFHSDDARPKGLCSVCYRKLLRCHSFAQMANRSEKIFSQLFKNNVEASHEYITELNHETKQHLLMAEVRTTESSQVTIKEEPILVKEEVTTEEDLLVEVERASPTESIQIQFKLEEVGQNNNEDLSPKIHVEITNLDNSKVNRKSDSDLNDKEKPFACNKCNKQYNHNSNLIKHMRIHTGDMPFSCIVCKKKFNRNDSLVLHMRHHTGEKPFTCNECDKHFTCRASCIAHKMTHTGEKPFACKICNKQFNHKSNLIRHKITHTGDKPFACNVCDKQFNLKSNLAKHVKIHTGEKPFVCYVCNKQFKQKGHLDTHMKSYSHVIVSQQKPLSL